MNINRTRDGYLKELCTKPWEQLILEPEDWTEAEWGTICKVFGMERAERIVVSNYVFEAYGAKKVKE